MSERLSFAQRALLQRAARVFRQHDSHPVFVKGPETRAAKVLVRLGFLELAPQAAVWAGAYYRPTTAGLDLVPGDEVP